MLTTLSPVLVRRLAFAKYLLATGVEKTKQPEPLAAAGLLSLHDAVEFANHVASEHLGAVLPPKATFLDYWGALDKVLAPKVLPQRTAMEPLNKARVALKHHGTMPSRLDLDSFVETARRFFMDMFPLVFGMDFHSVSMVEFVASRKTRDHLTLAQGQLQSGTLKDGLTEAAAAFSELLFDFEKDTKDEMGRPLIGAATHRSRIGGLLHDVNALGEAAGTGLSELRGFVVEVARAIEVLDENIKLVAFGIDLRRFGQFRRLTPYVARTAADTLHFTWSRDASADAADLEFCIQFVLDSALRVQEFEARSASGFSSAEVTT